MQSVFSLPVELKGKVLDFLRRRPPHPSGAARDFYHVSVPAYPDLRFEWHPKKRIVYLVRLGRTPLVGEAICHNIETHGDAWNAVLHFTRGLAEGLRRAQPRGLVT